MPRRAATTRAMSDAASPDLLDRVGDPQHARHALGILGTARGEHGGRAEPSQIVGHARLESFHLASELVLVEEDRRVREVDHQLGGVLELDEEIFDVARLVHQVTPNTDMTKITAATPVRSSVAVMVGTP